MAAIVNTALFTLRGSFTLLEAVFGGTIKTLGRLCSELRFETGKIKSGGSMEQSVDKYEAVKVTLKAAMYMSLIKLPRSNMIFCCSANKGRKLVMS